MRPAAAVAAAAALVLLLAACGGPQDAGGRVTPSAGSSTAVSTGDPAPADLVAAADLADCPSSDPDVAAREDGLPDLVLPCLGDGPGVRLAGLRGKPTVVNLWASWCEPCREELPLLADLAGSGAVRVIGIDVQDDPGAALSLLTDAGVRYPSVRDDASATKAPLRWTGLPMTVFVDADGVVTHERRGVITDADELAALVQEHLGVAVPSS